MTSFNLMVLSTGFGDSPRPDYPLVVALFLGTPIGDSLPKGGPLLHLNAWNLQWDLLNGPPFPRTPFFRYVSGCIAVRIA